ncbi:MAG: response regulator [Stappiaceae bacterium]
MVDDNIDEVFITRRIVRKAGIVNRFMTVQHPENLMATLDEQVQSGCSEDGFLILLDINMPRKSGLEVLKEIRAHPVYKNVLVFMLSVSEEACDVDAAREFGCDGYFVKPFSVAEFCSNIIGNERVKKQFMH